ncbi:MAG: ASCH domain-containing protein [Paludibacter sp.]
MKAITIKQPWAWLIVEGVKDIENRTWPTSFMGRVLIHASAKQCEVKGLLSYSQQEHLISKIPNKMPIQDNLVNGAIIGSVEIVHCVLNHSSVWADHLAYKKKQVAGRILTVAVPVYNWVLANPIIFPEPIPAKGKLSFWDYEFDENTFECINTNPYRHQSCGEREGCIQNCDECDYWKSKYEES